MRRSLVDVEDAFFEKEIARYQVELDELEAELQAASANRKAKVRAKIDAVRGKLEAKEAALAARVEALEREAEAKMASLREQISFGLYDLDRVEPPVVLRRGGAGESYEGIRKGPVNVDGRPVLVDARGPFGNPTSDSERTMITTATRRALVVAFAPATCPAARLTGIVERTAALLARHNGGTAGPASLA